MTWLLLVLLILSLAANGFQWYRWHSYRTQSAGAHSHTAVMPKITQDQIKRDRMKGPDG